MRFLNRFLNNKFFQGLKAGLSLVKEYKDYAYPIIATLSVVQAQAYLRMPSYMTTLHSTQSPLFAFLSMGSSLLAPALLATKIFKVRKDIMQHIQENAGNITAYAYYALNIVASVKLIELEILSPYNAVLFSAASMVYKNALFSALKYMLSEKPLNIIEIEEQDQPEAEVPLLARLQRRSVPRIQEIREEIREERRVEQAAAVFVAPEPVREPVSSVPVQQEEAPAAAVPAVVMFSRSSSGSSSGIAEEQRKGQKRPHEGHEAQNDETSMQDEDVVEAEQATDEAAAKRLKS